MANIKDYLRGMIEDGERRRDEMLAQKRLENQDKFKKKILVEKTDKKLEMMNDLTENLKKFMNQLMEFIPEDLEGEITDNNVEGEAWDATKVRVEITDEEAMRHGNMLAEGLPAMDDGIEELKEHMDDEQKEFIDEKMEEIDETLDAQEQERYERMLEEARQEVLRRREEEIIRDMIGPVEIGKHRLDEKKE